MTIIIIIFILSFLLGKNLLLTYSSSIYVEFDGHNLKIS